ncbi:MAG: amidohydrolase family protein [Thermodesulfobacteriota bacterium]
MYHRTYLAWLGEQEGAWAKKSLARVEEAVRCRPHRVDVGERLAQLDRNGIDLQVVAPTGGELYVTDDPAQQLAMARIINEGMARLMEESKGRLIAGGTIPLTGFEQGGGKEMTRAIKALGLKAITVPSNFRGKPLDLPELEPFWTQAAEMGIPVYIHPAAPERHRDRSYEGEYDLNHNFGWPFETTLALSRLVFSGVMERYPGLKVVGHHLGGGIPFFWGRTNETYDLTNVTHTAENEAIGRVLTKPLFDYFSQFYYDTAVGGSASAIRCAYEIFGADQLLFATDAPNGPGSGEVRLATYPDVIKSLGLSEGDNRKIFADNARRMLNLG